MSCVKAQASEKSRGGNEEATACDGQTGAQLECGHVGYEA